VQLLNSTPTQIFSMGDRVEITNNLYKTLQRSTTMSNYLGRVIDITTHTVLISTDSSEQIRRYLNNVVKVQQDE